MVADAETLGFVERLPCLLSVWFLCVRMSETFGPINLNVLAGPQR